MISVEDHVTNLSRRHGDFTRKITGDSQNWGGLFDHIQLTNFIYTATTNKLCRLNLGDNPMGTKAKETAVR